jgi:hypothetical protein
VTRVTYPSLEHVAIEKRPYPAELLEGCQSGLVLFAAAFLGHNDAIHFAEAGVPNVTLVDVDGERLEEMRGLYRDPSWEWLEADAWDVARDARRLDAKFDAVSVDTFTGAALERSLGDLELWTSIARRVVTVTATRDSSYRVPRHWRSRVLGRSSLAYWLILEPDRVAA